MKTTTATIRFVLITSRTNKKGECPIVLRVQWNGRKEKYTGFSVPKLKWDSKNECVKPCKSLPYAFINETLIKTKSKLLKKKALYESKGMPYTAADLLSENEPVAFDKRFSALLRRMIDSKKLSTNTIWSYNASLKRVETYFGDGVDVCSFNDANLTGFCKWMKSQGYSDSTVNTNMACIKSVVAFASASGVDVGKPFANFKYWKKYRIGEKKICLSKQEMDDLLSYFLNQSVGADAFEGQWWYTDEAYIALMNRNSELFSLCCFLLSYQLQGLAFADLVRIRAENISVTEIKGVRYYCVHGIQRKKTNVPVKDIYVEITDEVNPLFHCYYTTMGERGGYFLPVLQNNGMRYHYGNDEKKITEATGSCSVTVNRNLKEIFKKLDIDGQATFYSARHSWATHFILNGGNPVLLAELMGRSVNGIFRYVSGLTSVEHTINERKRVF